MSVFRFIAKRKAEHSVKTLCRVLGISRSGFHAWERRAPSDRQLADGWLSERIREIHAESRQTYGARRVHAALAHRGVRVGRKRVERLMRRLGLSMRPDLEAELVVDALEMAVARRRPIAGLVHHSDQGSQYVSLVFGERCRTAGVQISMGSKGDAYDNAVAESFFASLEKDLLRRRSFTTRQDARTAVFDYIETFYNTIRLHSTLGYLWPIEYENIKLQERRAAA